MLKNSKLLLLLLLFLPSQLLFGANWVDEFPIYIYGDVSFLAQIYEFVWKVTKDDAIKTLVGLGITVTVFIAGFQLKDGDVWRAGKTIAAPITLLALFYTPTSTIHIVDKRLDHNMISGDLSSDGGYQKIDNIPYAIAFLPATATYAVNLMIDIIDNSWDSVHIANKFSGTGFRESEKTLFNVATFKEIYGNDEISPKLQHNLDRYLHGCILSKAMVIGGAKNAQYFKASGEPFPEMLNPSKYPTDFGNLPVALKDYESGEVITTTCKVAYDDIKANQSKYEEAAEHYLRSKEPNKNFSSTSYNEGVLGVAASKVGDLKKAALTTMTAKRLQHMAYKDSVGLDGYTVARDLTIESTLNNMALEGPAKLSWISRVLPDIINILTGIAIAAFPFLVLVQFFTGTTAYKAILNYFMGLFAIYFNLVALALVQNIISFYEQGALGALAEKPFSSNNIEEFIMQQAQMGGLAGLIGAIAVLGLTPLIFYGEWKGINGAIGGVTGAFRGDVIGTSQKQMSDYAVEAEIDKRQFTEDDANAWLTQNGYMPRDNQTSLQMFNEIQRGIGAAGAGLTAKDIMHSGNMPNYLEGSYGQSTQQSMRTVGFGSSIAGNISSVSDVSMQDGQVMAETMKATDSMRKERGYNTEDIGTGMAAAQYAKDMGASFTGSRIGSDMSSNNEALSALVASSVDQSLKQLSAGKGLIDSLAYDGSGNLITGSREANLLEQGYANQARLQANMAMGAGKEDLSGPQGIEKMNNIQHLGHAQFQGQIGRGAASRDALLEDSNYYAKANEWGERSSIAQTKGSMKAYEGDKDFDKGLEAMAQAVQDDSLTKAYGQMSGMKKARKDGLIKEDGSLNDSGKEAFALQSNEAISALVGKGNIGKNIGDALSEIFKQEFEAAIKTGKSKQEASEIAAKTVAPFINGEVQTNGDGSLNTNNALTGLDFWNKNAELKAGSFSGSNSIMLGGGSIFSGGLGQDGEVTGTVNRGLASKTDNSIKNDSSVKISEGTEYTSAQKWANVERGLRAANGDWDNLSSEEQQKQIKAVLAKIDASKDAREGFLDKMIVAISEVTGLSPEEVSAAALAVGGYAFANQITGGGVNKGIKTGWDKTKAGVNDLSDRFGFTSSSDNINNPTNSTPDNSTNKQNPNQDSSVKNHSSDSSSHKNPPNKFIPDSFGRMIPNPDYELYQKNAEKSKKMAKYGTGSLVGMGMYAFDSWAQGKSAGEVFSDMKNVLSNKYNEYGNVYDVGTSLFVGDDAQRKINATSNPFKAVGYAVTGMANTAVDGAYAISAVAANSINGFTNDGSFKQNYQLSSLNQTYSSGLFNAVYGSNTNSNVFANNSQQTISYNTGEQTEYLRDVLSGQEENHEAMYRLFEKMNDTTKG